MEGVEVAGTRVLAEVAVQLDAGHARLVELAGERLGAVLGAGEDQRAAGCAGQLDQDRDPLLALQVQHVVGHARDRRLRRVGLVGDRLDEELLDQAVDGLVERGREEQPLAAARGPAEQPAYGGEEAEVGHVVGLVEHGDLDRAQVAVTLADQVLEPARAGQHDVGALAEARDLGVLADAAEDDDGGEAGGRGERLQRGVDLDDQLTGRCEHEGARPARRRPAALGEPGDQRQQERVRLAGAGAASAEDVPAGERVGQGRGLDRSGKGDAPVGQHGREGDGNAETVEGLGVTGLQSQGRDFRLVSHQHRRRRSACRQLEAAASPTRGWVVHR